MSESDMTVEVSISSKTPEKFSIEAKFVEDSITEVGHVMGRYMDPTPIGSKLLDPESVATDKKIAEILSHVKDDSPKIDPTTDQGVAEATENMIGRAEAAIEQATVPEVKHRIEKFKNKNAKGVASLLTRGVSISRRNFLKAASVGAFALVLNACAPSIVRPVVTPDGGGGGTTPTVTEVMIPTETTEVKPTPETTSTPEAASWDFSQKPPTLTSENAKFETSQDGNAKLTFTNQGKEYFIAVEKPQELIDVEGKAVTGGELNAKIHEKAYEGQATIIYSEDGETLAWFNVETGQWVKRFETLFERTDFPKPPEWLPFPPNGGRDEMVFERKSTDEIYDYLMTIIGKPVRVYLEKYPNPGDFGADGWVPGKPGEFVDALWVSMDYGIPNKLMDIMIYTDKQQSSQLLQIVNQYQDYVGREWSVPVRPPYKKDELLDALTNASAVRVQVGFMPPSEYSGWTNHKDFSAVADNPVLRDTFFQKSLTDTEKSNFFEGMKTKDYSRVPDRIRLSYIQFWIFQIK